jgi:hypothetical protein
MEHDTTSDETTEELNAGCGGGGGFTDPYYPSMCTDPYKLLTGLF